MIAHNEIPWVTIEVRSPSRRVSHAVAGVNHGWVSTFCNHFTPSFQAVTVPTRGCRVCRVCRAKLKDSSPPANLSEAVAKWNNAYLKVQS